MIIEVSDIDRKLIKLSSIVSGLMYKGDYKQIKQLYKELIENGTIEPIEHFSLVEDTYTLFLMSKFLVAFDRMEEESLEVPYNKDNILCGKIE